MRRILPSSFLADETRGRFWRYYDDYHARVELGAVTADDRTQYRNEQLANVVAGSPPLNDCIPYSFFPLGFEGDQPAVRQVGAVRTGGRTYRLMPADAQALGLPGRAVMDLRSLGWGQDLLEVHLEIKGAGVVWERAKLDQSRCVRLLEDDSLRPLQSSWRRACGDASHPKIGMSLSTYLGRNIGGQSEACASNAAWVSSSLFGASEIKFLPTWMTTALPAIVTQNIAALSRATVELTPIYSGRIMNELRFTPGSVRAVYFDLADSDDELVTLARSVSHDAQELEETAQEMVEDVRRHLDLLATSTVMEPSRIACRWTKLTDIHEIFGPGSDRSYPDMIEYQQTKRLAWFLAKDEIIVRKVGKFFTDLEGSNLGSRGFVSLLGQETRRHHGLVILNILRDHLRVCSQFEIARRLMVDDTLSRESRREIEQRILEKIRGTIGRTKHATVEIGAKTIEVTLCYPNLGPSREKYRFPRSWIAERFND